MAPAKREPLNAPVERKSPAHAKRRSARGKAETPRAPQRPRLRVVAPGARGSAAAESAASAKAVKAAKPRKARPIAAAR